MANIKILYDIKKIIKRNILRRKLRGPILVVFPNNKCIRNTTKTGPRIIRSVLVFRALRVLNGTLKC